MSVLLAQLDRRLLERGQIITLRRIVGTGPNATSVQIDVPAFVKASTVEDFTGTLVQQNLFVIISPTHILGTTWPGVGQKPMVKMGDKALIYGQMRNVERVSPFFEGNQCIRMDMVVKG